MFIVSIIAGETKCPLLGIKIKATNLVLVNKLMWPLIDDTQLKMAHLYNVFLNKVLDLGFYLFNSQIHFQHT